MKVALYGGMANNIYLFAKAFTESGIEVCFIRDRGDRYAFSQPVWEDMPFTLEYAAVSGTSSWTHEQWRSMEEQLGWKPPPWLIDPVAQSSSVAQSDPAAQLDFAARKFLDEWIRGAPHRQSVRKLMSENDVILVCGIEGTILALASGKPFVIMPHGGDIRTAAGLHPHKVPTHAQWQTYLRLLHLLRLSYGQALWIGGGAPRGSGGRMFSDILPFENEWFTFPTVVKPRMPKASRTHLLEHLMKSLGLPMPEASTVMFIPSRIDFYWKGTDRLFRALKQLATDRIHVILSGWGNDYEFARREFASRAVTFLPCALSKPMVYSFFQAVDIVADQFNMGHYGTSAIEAMGCGAPVLMWVDEQSFRARDWEPPPVLNARSEEQIFDILQQVLDGAIDLNAYGLAAQRWVERRHGSRVVTNRFLELTVPRL